MTARQDEELRRKEPAAAEMNVSTAPPQRLSSARAAAGSGVLLLAILAVAFAVGHGDRTPQRLQRRPEALDPAGSVAQAKPSAGIPFGAKRQVAPAATIAAIPAESVAGGTGIATVEAASTETQYVSLTPRETEGAFAAKHQKSFGRGCEGRLELTARSLDFACESGAEPALHLAVDEIRRANSNGIELKTGEKYHFDLQRSKSEEQEIFRNWVSTHSDGPGRGLQAAGH